MSNNSERVISWRKRTKERIVQSFGGKCGICEYSRCHESLDLHHINPNEKSFGLSCIRANPMSWDKIVQELRKCVLICRNCHGEYHSGLIKIPDTILRFDEKFSDYKKLQSEDRRSEYYNSCPLCGTEKFHSQKTCSLKCAAKLRYSVDWDKIDLTDLYEVKGMSFSGIAKIVGCSGGAVKKRLRKIGLI